MKFKKDNKNKKKKGLGGAVDLTPVVDTVFNLLIFFALSLNFAATSGSISVNLPKATSVEPVKPQELTINIDKEGKLFLDKNPISIEELTDRLEKTSDKNSLIIIRADSSVTHGRVVEIMDIAREAEFSRLAIAVEAAPPKEEK